MAVGDLILVNAYIIQICLPLNSLGLMFRQAREALINAERMAELLRLPSENENAPDLPPIQIRQGGITFENVEFSYEPGRQILRGVSFEVAPRATVAVVGSSGSGKSTIARLLLRMYDADRGRILIDGQDLRSVSHDSIRRAIGVVPQDSMLFNNTIGYNIAYGRPGASPAEVIEAAKAARIHDLIESLPAKYETMVGERGVKLSGGERQRISIARAILKNPPLLIFDEATSALDSQTERAIQEELDRLAQGRSTVIIAHRLSTVVDADQIIVMEHGRILERGTHHELLQREGRYAQMWKLQREERELEEMERQLRSQPINLVAMLGGVIDALRIEADARGITFYTGMAEGTVRVTGDPSMLQHVLLDLSRNAMGLTPPHGRLEMRLEINGDLAGIRITDGRHHNGYIEPELGPEYDAGIHPVKVIDPLKIKALMERMGGRFEVEHVDEGPSISYVVYLPLRAVAPQEVPQKPVLDPAQIRLDGLLIAVADDREEARRLVGEVLEDQGAVVQRYESGTALLEALKSESESWPDVLVCDLGLGDPDGYQVIEEIRRMELKKGKRVGQQMPAIALSGYGEQRNRLRALLAGFQIHITKPVDARELLASVAAVIRRKA
jgi:ABC-type transport system involved in Fe-S cluster assembly, permease and ATPase components